MRRFANRSLSIAPPTAIGIMTLYSAAHPDKFTAWWDWFALQLQDVTTFRFLVAGVVIYAALWWLTSMEPTSRREKLKRGMRPFYAETAAILSALKRYEHDEELRAALLETDTHQQGVVDWLELNMGQAAVRKFLTVNRPSHCYVWIGQHDQALVNRRDQYLDALHGRVENLEQLLESDSWDGPQPTLCQRFTKVIGRR
jgi:hypothetical protein